MLNKLEEIKHRYQNIGEQLYDPEIAADPKRFNKLNKEHKDLEPIVQAFDKYCRLSFEGCDHYYFVQWLWLQILKHS